MTAPRAGLEGLWPIATSVVAAVALGLGCRPAPLAPPLPCPAGMLLVPATTAELGEGDASLRARHAPNTVVPRGRHEVAPYCVDAWPMGTGAGAPWPTDGINRTLLASTILPLLERSGRRLCTVQELMLAAGGPAGWRYPYGDERKEGVCDHRDEAPAPMGSFSGCVSPLGAREFLVRSTWATLDPASKERLDAAGASAQPGYGEHAVAGGLVREDTYYAPTNFGVHFHESDAPAFSDDGLRACAAPGAPSAVQEAAWVEAVALLMHERSFASLSRLTPPR